MWLTLLFYVILWLICLCWPCSSLDREVRHWKGMEEISAWYVRGGSRFRLKRGGIPLENALPVSTSLPSFLHQAPGGIPYHMPQFLKLTPDGHAGLEEGLLRSNKMDLHYTHLCIVLWKNVQVNVMCGVLGTANEHPVVLGRSLSGLYMEFQVKMGSGQVRGYILEQTLHFPWTHVHFWWNL